MVKHFRESREEEFDTVLLKVGQELGYIIDV